MSNNNNSDPESLGTDGPVAASTLISDTSAGLATPLGEHKKPGSNGHYRPGRQLRLPTINKDGHGCLGLKESEKPAITGKQILRLLEAQEYCCAVTGIKLSPTTASLDHIVAVSKGGSHDIYNLMIMHSDLNQAKRAQSIDEFVGMCCAVAGFMTNGNATLIREWRAGWLASHQANNG